MIVRNGTGSKLIEGATVLGNETIVMSLHIQNSLKNSRYVTFNNVYCFEIVTFEIILIIVM